METISRAYIAQSSLACQVQNVELSLEKVLKVSAIVPTAVNNSTMQKVIRRTVLAERQAARRLAAKKLIERRDEEKQQRLQTAYSRKEQTGQIKAARLARREDYELGPLAPRRDVGDLKEKYGTIGSHRLNGAELKEKELTEKLKTVGGRFLNIVAGDRVVVLEGKDKGKIGKIRSTDKKRAECIVEGMNLADVAIPQYMISAEDPDQRPVRSIETPIPITSVRLVHPLTDPETGITRDVIVKKVENTKIWHDRHTGSTTWSRIIPGLNVVIPWPKKEPEQFKDGPYDTLRSEVEERSFVPTMLTPPIPSTVIDELRNKFSKFRTRHDPEYIAAKMEEDRVAAEKKALTKKMRTPLTEANRKARKERKKKGKGQLTPDMLEKIGEVMAQRQQLVLKTAGIAIEDSPKTEFVEPVLA